MSDNKIVIVSTMQLQCSNSTIKKSLMYIIVPVMTIPVMSLASGEVPDRTPI